ncbi:MAG TPA: PAS domain-containing sensor histidine kinase [Candidatus Dormibacteraeota bacterium]|nr:PAS domain-containing sensor histidine kinase [Candidatus Dormibacteraeota bacterium]
MRRFAPAAIAAVVLTAPVALVALQVGGEGVSSGVRHAGLAVTEFAALISCGLMARLSTGRPAWAWALLAASAGTALAGDVVDGLYAVAIGNEPPFPSPDDVGVLAAVPFAIAGLLAFPPAPNLYATLRRTVLDGAVVVFSLTFIVLAVSLPQAFMRQASNLTWWVGPAYPVADVALFTVIFVALRRSIGTQGGRLVWIVGGLAVSAVSYMSAAFLLASGHSTLGHLFESGSMFGYAMIAVAPLWPPPELRQEPVDISLWQALLPYAGLAAVAITALWIWAADKHPSPYVGLPAFGLAVVIVASQIQSHLEARSVLRQSRQAEGKLRQREAMLNDVIDHAPQGVAAITIDRRIIDTNPRLAAMLYAPEQTLLGGSTDSFLPEDYVKRVFRNLADAAAGGSDTYEADCQARRADGSQFWVHWSATPIRKRDGSIDYFMATFEDVTAKREAEETAVANLAQLEKLNRLKTEFVSMVSHEFRTGLVGIMGFSELIHDQDLEVAEIKILAEELNGEAQRLNRMITDMLDFDRLEAGKVRLNLQPLDLNQLVNEAIERAAMTTDKHSITADLAPRLPNVLGDSDRLTQVLTNLMSNAIKYSPNGGDICVSTRLNSGSVEVSVRDHGKGIPAEFIKRLFGRYERYEDKHAGKIIGTGLGLAITRQIVEMHGGRISVDSVVGEGSEFHFTIPLASGLDVAATRSA